MKYEIVKDKENLYVLIVNNITVLISRDLAEITAEIHKDAKDRTINPRRKYYPAVININLPKNTNKLQIIGKLPEKVVIKKDISPDDGALGALFDL